MVRVQKKVQITVTLRDFVTIKVWVVNNVRGTVTAWIRISSLYMTLGLTRLVFKMNRTIILALTLNFNN